ADRDRTIERLALRSELSLHLADRLARPAHIVGPAYDRKQDGDRVASAHTKERAQLRAEHLGVAQQQAQAALGERGIARWREGKIRQHLVAADVDEPERQRPRMHALRGALE